MEAIAGALLMCGACYLIGAIPFGFLAGKARGIDIRTRGSRNIGATNVGRVLGRRLGLMVFVLDVAKGLVPTLACGLLLSRHGAEWGLTGWSRNLLWLTAGICCVLGHSYSIYLGFRGGKGVATSLGVVLGVYPYLTAPGAAAFGVWMLVTLATRYVSLGSVCAAIVFPVFFAAVGFYRGYDLLGTHWPLLGFSVLVAALVVYRHRGNLGRLRAGTEPRIGGKRPGDRRPGDGRLSDKGSGDKG